MMKKRLIILILLFALLVSGCISDSSENNRCIEPKDEKLSEAVNLKVLQTNLLIQPYENFLYAQTYTKDGWLYADGMRSTFLLPKIFEELPTIVYDKTLSLQVNGNAQLSRIDVFDSDMTRTNCQITEEEFFDICEELDSGTYYIAVVVTYKGKYIESEEKHESFGDEYIFRMDVEEIETDSTDAPALGDTERRVDSIGPSSYEELANLTGEKRSKAMSYNMEHCYFKMSNISEVFEEVYVSIWEIGFIARYKNPKTNERIELTWWANRKQEDYKKSIQDYRNLKVISRNGIEFYCSFVTIGKESTDKTAPSETPHHAEIRWIEDGKCFYVNVVSATPLDETALKYCELEKFTLN